MAMKIYQRLTQFKDVLKLMIMLMYRWPFSKWLRFWLTSEDEKVVEIDGIKLVVRAQNFFTKTSDIFMAYECIIKDTYRLNEVKSAGINYILDIGGHMGSFSLAAANRFPKAKIISFEPSPSNHRIFKKNIVANNLKNITLFNKAVTSHGKDVSIYIDPINSAANSLYTGKGKVVKAPSMSLDKIFKKNKIKKCDFLKIDAEGAEYDILLNARINTLKKIQNIAIEYHDPKYFGIKNKKYNLDGLVKHLKKSGFLCKVNKEKRYQGVLFARR